MAVAVKAIGESSEEAFRFIEAKFGEENGLYYMRARYYDPEIGRFASKDPIGLAGGINMYAYAHNNPINRIDPFGRFDNPLPKLPSFSESFPDSDFIAPVADIIVGGIEGSFGFTLGVASVVGLVAGPETWWIPIVYGGVAIEVGADGIGRMSAGIERLGHKPTLTNKPEIEMSKCH